MNAAPDTAEQDGAAPKPAGRARRMVLLAGAVALPVLAGGGLWLSGLLPQWLGMTHEAPADAVASGPVLVAVPDIVTNLNTQGRRPVFLKLRSKVEVAKSDEAAIQEQMPRIVDLFQTLLRELRPEELRGSAGTQLLKEELIARANIAVAPVRISDVLFTEMLVQ